MKIIATIEARMTSSRLPGKVLMESCGKPMLEHMIERLRRSKRLDDIVVATTTNSEDNLIVTLCEKLQCHYYRGSEDDVLDRVLKAAKRFDADVIVETTGDCPLIDWRQIDELIDIYKENDYDYVSNSTERTYPDGFDIRIFSTDALDIISKKDLTILDREHVSIYFPQHPQEFKCYNLLAESYENRPDIEVTLDEIGDFKLLDSIICGLSTINPDFSCRDVIEYIDENPELKEYVEGIKRKGIS
ncbi:MAG: glycosyltransferase family protein [Lachnospiraceae bacterium]|nr:glycosyltransferase family protein [Lachnospiraceae bacterium]